MTLNRTVSFDELVRKVQQQEDTVAQLVKIIAATNHRVSEVKNKQDSMKIYHSRK